jgi:UrcA family protein
MRNLSHILTSRRLYAVVAAGVVLAGTPAFAQTVDELTVTGRLGPDGAPRSLSQAVSYGDLDLRLASDQAALKSRVKDAARDLCDRLGESNTAYAPIVPSCRDAAYNDAISQVKMAVAEAPARNAYASAQAADASAVAPMDSDMAAAPDTYVAPAAAVAMPAPTYTVRTVTNGPVPDTAENRSRFGAPLSRAGMNTAPSGN